MSPYDVPTEAGSDLYTRWNVRDVPVTTIVQKAATIELGDDIVPLDNQILGLITYHVFRKLGGDSEIRFLCSDDAEGEPLDPPSWSNRFLVSLPDAQSIGSVSLGEDRAIERALLKSASAYNVCIKDQSRTQDYLSRHPDLMRIVTEACEAVRRRFPQPDQLVLELFTDPDSSDEFLTLNVRQEEYSHDLIQILEDLTDPFEERISTASGWFLISTDFERPDY